MFQEVDVKAADGTMHNERVPAAKVVPGTEVIYVITYRNAGKQPATEVVITNPIPAELAYRPERARSVRGARGLRGRGQELGRARVAHGEGRRTASRAPPRAAT